MTQSNRGPDGSDGDDAGASRRTERREPVGEPVVRGDPEIAGGDGRDAVRYDPADPESLESASETCGRRIFSCSPSSAASIDSQKFRNTRSVDSWPCRVTGFSPSLS